MGDVLGGTCSGSAYGSLYWGNGKGLISFLFAVQEPECVFHKNRIPALSMVIIPLFLTQRHEFYLIQF